MKRKGKGTGKVVVGIDVGFSGAVVFIGDKGQILDLYDMPVINVKKGKKNQREIDEPTLCDLLSLGCDHVFIEKAQSMPGQGVSSTGKYMMGFGIIRGICVGLGLPYTLVTPQAWKKAMMKGMGKEKGASIVRAKQLYPKLVLDRKKDHGKADALLIACYGLKELI